MTEQTNNGKPTTGTFRTIHDGGFIGRPPTSAPARNQTQASAKPAKPRMTDAEIDAVVIGAMRKLELATSGQTPIADALAKEARIRLTQRQLLAQVAQVPLDQVGTLLHE
jgi:hypothetical protein